MSTRIKFNVKNVILGRHHFSDLLATHETRMLTGLSRLVVPRAIPLNRSDCDYYKQTYIRRSKLSHAEAVAPQTLENLSLEQVPSEKPVTSKWLDEVLTGPICTPPCGLPWDSPYSFYYDKKCPQCPPSVPKARSDCRPDKSPCPEPSCPPPKVVPSCPQKPRCFPCYQPKKADPCAKTTPFTMKTLILNSCRFFSANPCKPRDPPKKAEACKPKRCEPKKPKCVPPQSKKKDACDGRGKVQPRACKPVAKLSPCGGGSGGGGGALKKGPVCPGSSGGSKLKKGPVCPGGDKLKKGPVCPGSGDSVNRGPVCK